MLEAIMSRYWGAHVKASEHAHILLKMAGNCINLFYSLQSKFYEGIICLFQHNASMSDNTEDHYGCISEQTHQIWAGVASKPHPLQ